MVRPSTPKLAFALVFAAFEAIFLAGCSPHRPRHDAANPESEAVTATSGWEALAGPDALETPGESGALGPLGGHPYFPFVPGRTSDFHVFLLEAGEADMRITVGAPEVFFGRLATPWVYGAIPGAIADSSFLDLRNYFSTSPAGDLWFHGMQNKGVLSVNEPPIRILPAEPHGGESWRDTVLFESFYSGALFDRATIIYETRISERSMLRLPAGTFHAYRSTQIVIDVIRPAGAVVGGASLDAAPTALVPLRGFWFARRRGIVARDYPQGRGPSSINSRTYVLTGQGRGPIPPLEPVP